jgi:stearoyl-CoA desaturase (delta-9 desaturase)
LSLSTALAPVRRKKRRKSSSKSAARRRRAGGESRKQLASPVAGPQRQQALLAGPRVRWASGLDWPSVMWLTLLHVAALAAPFCFTWKGLAMVFVIGWLTGGVGICLAFHRMLTHGSFQTYRPVRWFLAWLGGLAGEGPALTWVAVHRQHHQLSDQEGDPHSPRDGGWWSHMLWLAPKYTSIYKDELARRYAPDLLRDPVIRFLDRTFLLWHFLLGGALWAVGYYFWDTYTAWSFLVYGLFLRLVYVLHVTWFVNSASHMWGYRNYQTTDDSRNLWWVALLAFGEGWHNNHHAYQRMARHGHRWWEVDITYATILVLERLGLAWSVVHDVPGRPKG